MINRALWQPSASIRTLHQRAAMVAQIRCFFSERGYLEVETPVLGHFGVSDPYLTNLSTVFRNEVYALQTSPEYHMKRLLASGSGPIMQIARVFRDDELGRWHNPEFSLLEWYQLDWDHLTLLAEVDCLLQQVLHVPPLRIKTYRDAFLDACDLDPLSCTEKALQAVLQRFELDNVLTALDTRDDALFLLMSHVVEPTFATSDRPIAVIDFPPSQASLAVVRNGVASRFEVYYRGVELANGFHELTCPELQAARFAADNRKRRDAKRPECAVDTYLLSALQHGLPNCSGVALGLERLLALGLQQSCIAETMAFDIERA